MTRSMIFLLAGLIWGECAANATDKQINFKKPLVYTTSLMAVGWGALVGSGIAESDPSLNNFKRAFTSPPRKDDDSALFNYVLHPLWGSETYLRAREGNFGIAGSVAFNLAASVAWEYLFESWVQQPSTQDLIVTTSAGSLLGELRHRIKQRTGENVHWWIDPIDTTFDRLKFGIRKNRTSGTQFSVAYSWLY